MLKDIKILKFDWFWLFKENDYNVQLKIINNILQKLLVWREIWNKILKLDWNRFRYIIYKRDG